MKLTYEVYEVVCHKAADGGHQREILPIKMCLFSTEAIGLADRLRAEDTLRDIRVDAVEEYEDDRVETRRIR